MLSLRCGFAEIYGSCGARLLAFRVLTYWETKKNALACTRLWALLLSVWLLWCYCVEKTLENMDFWCHTVLYVAVGWCGAKTASVNFRKMKSCFCLLVPFLQNIRGYAHIMLCFQVKSEIGQNFRVHSAGLVSVICRWCKLLWLGA